MKYTLVSDGRRWAVKRTRTFLWWKTHSFLYPGVSRVFWFGESDAEIALCWLDYETALKWIKRFEV